MFSYIKNLWNEKGYEIVIIFCSVFILLYGLYCKIFKKNKGNYSKSYYLPSKRFEVKSPSKPSGKKYSKGEEECRRVLQHLFGLPFKDARPDFLRNPVTGGSFNLELDCFEPKLRLAVEYNGAQHYHFIPHFHKNKEAFLNQKYRDDMKRRICAQKGINLIEVPYTIKIENIYDFIVKKLKIFGYRI